MSSITDKGPSRITKITCEPLPPIELVGARPPAAKALRWDFVMTWFMRVVALLWVFHSLLNWGSILGVEALARTDATKLGPREFFATVIFACIDPIAAVGLWLATSWGGVVWLLAVAAQVSAVFAARHQFANGFLIIATDIGLVVCYVVLSFATNRETD